MKSCKFAIVAAFAMALFAACFSSTTHADEVDTHLKALQGTWKMTSLYMDGKKLTGDEVDGMKIVIEGDKMTLAKMTTVFAVAKPQEAGFSIDWANNTMDLHFGGETVLALYSHSENGMTICINKSPKAPRPERLGTHDSQIMILLTRETK